ncbi:hypothetical protein WN943_000898 [Citrus x changshan-huyou]
MDDEITSFYKNNTWKLVRKPDNRRLVGCKWIYRIIDGVSATEPRRFKARLVAKGYTQKEGIDFKKVFSHVVRHASIKVLLALTAVYDMELDQLDVPIGDDDQSNFEDTVQPEEPNKKETPELELKPLLEELKYVYLGEQQTYPVVISSQLMHDQEDQILERVAGYPYHCFLDGYSCYYQIPITLEDQENTIFTCLFGTFAFRRMPFGLCNAPATFQRCMLSICSDMVENCLQVFMDDLTVFGEMPCDWSSQDKKKFLTEVRRFYWDNPYLFKYCLDRIFQRCIPDDEKIYKARCERLCLLMINGILADIRWLIEVKVRLAAKNLFICALTTNELFDLLQAYKPEPDPMTLALD